MTEYIHGVIFAKIFLTVEGKEEQEPGISYLIYSIGQVPKSSDPFKGIGNTRRIISRT